MTKLFAPTFSHNRPGAGSFTTPLLLLLGLFLFNTAAAQDAKGKIAGKLIDKALGEELIGVTVQVQGASMGAVTDVEGKFLFAVNPGTYSLLVTYTGYQDQTISDVVVKSNEVTYIDIAMSEARSAIKEVVVTATITKSSALATMIERKNAAQVSDGVSADLIRRTPDRSTSDVLKRVTGASIQEGKFAVIRGMNDRYNVGYLDGALLPSTESDRKAFAFDVVPASLIDQLLIVKAGSPDNVGDFGGGVIKINTKAIPEKLTQNISIGGQLHSLTQFKDFTQFKKYSGEDFNFYGNQRDLPTFADGALSAVSAFPTAEEKTRFAEISRSFNNDWSIDTKQALPNARFAYSLGFPIRLSDTKKLGFITAINYASTKRFSESEINTFDGGGQVTAFKDNSYLQNVTSGGILNLNYVAGKTQINFRNLLNFNADNNTIVRTGIANISDDLKARNYANLINYNRLYNSIVSLKQAFGKGFTVNAAANYSNVRRRVPDYRIANYALTVEDENYRLSLGDFFNTSTGRFSSDLKERAVGANLDLSKQITGVYVKTELKAGGFYQNRHRTFSGRSFVVGGNAPATPSYELATDLGPEMIGASRLYYVEKTANDLGYYQGDSDLSAVYGMADQKFDEKLRATYGVRYEYADIHVTNQKINTEVARIKQGSVLPSANLSYSLTEKTNLRAAYYASVNRPEFRELAPFAFYVFDKNADIRGNKDLKIATLNNFELRYEFYPSGSQVLSAGAFYKSIQNPVEFSIDIAQPFTTFTFGNEKSAKVYGMEFEVRKNLDFIGKKPFLENIVVFANLALINSELAFVEGSRATPNRQLQGQSPYVLNSGVQFDLPNSGWFGSLVVNRIGRRIAYVGVDKQFGDTRQDIYENPRTVLDFQVGKNIKNFNLKLTLGDLLRQDLVFYQDANSNGKYDKTGNGDRLMFRYKNGFTTTLALSYTF